MGLVWESRLRHNNVLSSWKPVLRQGPLGKFTFWFLKTILKSRENHILSFFPPSSPIRHLDQENYKLLLQRRSPLQTCWRGSFNEASKPPCLWSWRLHYSLKHTEWSWFCSTLPSSLSLWWLIIQMLLIQKGLIDPCTSAELIVFHNERRLSDAAGKKSSRSLHLIKRGNLFYI